MWRDNLISSDRLYDKLTSKFVLRFSFQMRGHMRILLKNLNYGYQFKWEVIWVCQFKISIMVLTSSEKAYENLISKCEVILSLQVRCYMRISLQNMNSSFHFKWESIWESHFKMWSEILISSERLHENLTSKMELRFPLQVRGHMRVSLKKYNIASQFKWEIVW